MHRTDVSIQNGAACVFKRGVRQWMENKKVPESMTISQAIDLTRDAYGAKVYAGFFEKAGNK